MYVSKGEETKVYSLVELLKGGRKKKRKMKIYQSCITILAKKIKKKTKTSLSSSFIKRGPRHSKNRIHHKICSCFDCFDLDVLWFNHLRILSAEGHRQRSADV